MLSSSSVSLPLNFPRDRYPAPLDLLLGLIRKQQFDIHDIPVATVTSQYLEYLEKAREMDIDLGAEFVYMAATLIHIKSKMLLPRDPALEKEGELPEDPRQELVERLLEHERFKNAAEMLLQKRLIEENVWSNPQLKSFVSDNEDPGLAVTMFDLVKALGAMIERAKNRPVYEVEGADVTVAGMIRYLRDEFQHAGPDKPVYILRIFEKQRTRHGGRRRDDIPLRERQVRFPRRPAAIQHRFRSASRLHNLPHEPFAVAGAKLVVAALQRRLGHTQESPVARHHCHPSATSAMHRHAATVDALAPPSAGRPT